MTETTGQRALAAYRRGARGATVGEGQARAAAALAELADWVERLPPDDERLAGLAELSLSGADCFRPGEEAQWMAWRYGTGPAAEDRDAWLHRFLAACRSGAADDDRRVIDLTDRS